MSEAIEQYEVGSLVRVTKVLVHGEERSAFVIEGELLRMGQQKTGSWYAHSKDKKLWLDRVEIKKADGEIVVVNLDDQSQIEIVNAD